MSDYKRHLTAADRRAKEIIKACAGVGAGIEFLPDAPRFRFEPVTWEQSAFNGRESGPPSGRGSWAPKAKPHMAKIKNWAPARLSLNPMYSTPMAGDSRELTHARKRYSEGYPQELRAWLQQQAEARRADREELEAINLELFAA